MYIIRANIYYHTYTLKLFFHEHSSLKIDSDILKQNDQFEKKVFLFDNEKLNVVHKNRY